MGNDQIETERIDKKFPFGCVFVLAQDEEGNLIQCEKPAPWVPKGSVKADGFMDTSRWLGDAWCDEHQPPSPD